VSQAADLWWQQRRLWLPPLLLLLLAMAALVFYRTALAGRLGLEASSVRQQRAALEEVARARRETEGLLRRARTARGAIDRVYHDRLGSEEERLTRVMLEVKQLARQAGLSGLQTISYAGATAVGAPLATKSITFAAEGDYQQLRNFINLLEVTESFLAITEIRVQDSSGGGRLQLQVKLATLFYDPRPEASAA
jgi:hypothetical protein